MNILFFDTETNGLPLEYDAPVEDIDNWPRLIQLAWKIYNADGSVILQSERIIKPKGYVISPESTTIHGISQDTASKIGFDLDRVLKEFIYDLSTVDLIVAHNLNFDQSIIGCEFYRCGLNNPIPKIRGICTMKLTTNFCALGKVGNYKWPTLEELHFKLFNSAARRTEIHNANEDVELLTRCFFKLIDLRVIKVRSEKQTQPKSTSSGRGDTSNTRIVKDTAGNKLCELMTDNEELIIYDAGNKLCEIITDIDELIIYDWVTNEPIISIDTASKKLKCVFESFWKMIPDYAIEMENFEPSNYFPYLDIENLTEVVDYDIREPLGLHHDSEWSPPEELGWLNEPVSVSVMRNLTHIALSNYVSIIDNYSYSYCLREIIVYGQYEMKEFTLRYEYDENENIFLEYKKEYYSSYNSKERAKREYTYDSFGNILEEKFSYEEPY